MNCLAKICLQEKQKVISDYFRYLFISVFSRQDGYGMFLPVKFEQIKANLRGVFFNLIKAMISANSRCQISFLKYNTLISYIALKTLFSLQSLELM